MCANRTNMMQKYRYINYLVIYDFDGIGKQRGLPKFVESTTVRTENDSLSEVGEFLRGGGTALRKYCLG